jgi:hypothetical protein
MSRSYRHTPVVSRRWKGEKKVASRKVRHSDILFKNGEYRKVYEPYMIGYTFYNEDDNKRK